MKSTYLPAIIALLMMVSCNSKKTSDDAEIMSAEDLKRIIQTADAINPEVSSISDVFKTLDLANAKYYPVLCNDPYNAQNYKNSKSAAAANLGIYIADIVYHMYGQSTEEMFITFSAAQELARYMGIDSDFGAALITELEGGKISRDSLIVEFNNLLYESEQYNSNQELLHVHTAFLTGLYFEKLFITSSLIDQLQKQQNPTIEHMESFKELLVVFNKQLRSITVLTNSLDEYKKELEDTFNFVEIQNLMVSAIALNEKFKDIVQSDKIKLFDELTTMHKQIANIRTGITSAG